MIYEYYYTAHEVAQIYGISLTTARRLIKKIKEYYKVDEERLLKKGIIPKHLVEEYLTIPSSEKTKKGAENENSD